MIVVTPLGYGTSTGPAGGRTPENITGYTKILLEEVMPMVDKAYNVSRNREQRAIAGLSMGGAESLYVGLNNLDKFAWIGAFSSAPDAVAGVPCRRTRAAARRRRRRRGAGAAPHDDGSRRCSRRHFPRSTRKPTRDSDAVDRVRHGDGLIGVNRQFKDWLKSKGVEFTEQEVPDMGHVWPLWRQNLTDMVPRLFQAKGK